MSINDLESALRDEFKGYHLNLELYPSGGFIEFVGCDECGTDDRVFDCARWKVHKGESLESAIVELKSKLEKRVK